MTTFCRRMLPLFSLMLVIATGCGCSVQEKPSSAPPVKTGGTPTTASSDPDEFAAILAPSTEKQTGEVIADGSSTVFPITQAVAEEFMKVNSDVKVSVGIAGTGGGF